mgnify:CR=1 FL=1
MPQFGFNQGDDPLGIGLQERGRQNRERFNQAGQANAAQHGQLVPFSLPSLSMSPSMEGLFQAMQERGMDKLADPSVGAARGMWGQNPAVATNAPGQTSAIEESGRSSHIGAPQWNFASQAPQSTAGPGQTPIVPERPTPVGGLYAAGNQFRTPRRQ